MASVRLLQRRFDLGEINELDLSRARTELSTTRSDAIALERRRAQLEHALAVLLGKAPAALDLPAGALAHAMPAIPAGLPSSLLERRPDIAAARRAMAAANSRIGVAKAAFFPVLRLTAQGGYESGELSELFQWSSRTWALGPLVGTVLTMPVIDGGRNRANLDDLKQASESLVVEYRQRVLVAFSEVEDNLVNVRTLGGQGQATRAAVASASRSVAISQSRYRSGATGYLDVIDAQRNLLAARVARIEALRAQRAAVADLFRALGG